MSVSAAFVLSEVLKLVAGVADLPLVVDLALLCGVTVLAVPLARALASSQKKLAAS